MGLRVPDKGFWEGIPSGDALKKPFLPGVGSSDSSHSSEAWQGAPLIDLAEGFWGGTGIVWGKHESPPLLNLMCMDADSISSPWFISFRSKRATKSFTLITQETPKQGCVQRCQPGDSGGSVSWKLKRASAYGLLLEHWVVLCRQRMSTGTQTLPMETQLQLLELNYTLIRTHL